MGNAAGAQQNPQYCMLAGTLNVSLDGGVTWNPAVATGSGTIHTSAPLSGDGSVGTPATVAAGAIALSKLATQADQTMVGNVSGGVASPIALSQAQALTFLGLGASSWRDQMFAFSKTKYSTLGRYVLTDFSLGVNGDYTAAISNPNGGVTPAVNYPASWAGSGVEIDTGASTATSTSILMTRKGNPNLAVNILTGAPWFVASRARINFSPSATALIHLVAMTTTSSPFASASPALGIHGATSTVNWSLYDATGWHDTGVAFAVSTFYDLAIGFDGATMTAYVGQVAAGTMTAVGTSTTLTNFQSSPGQPGVIVFTSDTTRISADIASLFGASANPA